MRYHDIYRESLSGRNRILIRVGIMSTVEDPAKTPEREINSFIFGIKNSIANFVQKRLALIKEESPCTKLLSFIGIRSIRLISNFMFNNSLNRFPQIVRLKNLKTKIPHNLRVM